MANNVPDWEGAAKGGKNFAEKLGFGLYPPGYDRRVHGPYCPDRYYGPKDKPLAEVKLSELTKWIGRRDKSPWAFFQAIARAEFRYFEKFLSPVKATPGTYWWHLCFFTTGIFYLAHWNHLKHHKRVKYHW